MDALDESAANGWADSIAAQTGSIDVSVNLISQDALFMPLLTMPVADFGQAMDKVARSFLLTAQAAARHMVKQGSGVIPHFGGSNPANAAPGLGTAQVGCDLVEAMRRQRARELGPHSVRVVSMRTGGIPDTLPDLPETAPYKQKMVDATLLARAATWTIVGRVAAFLASEHAASITSTQVNISRGALVDRHDNLEISMNDDVTQYIDKTAPWQIDVCGKLRAMIHETLPAVEEQLQYGKPHFLKNGQFAAVIAVSRARSPSWGSTPRTFRWSRASPGSGQGERKVVDIEEGQDVDYTRIADILEKTTAAL